jgi:hypothetical protein
MDATEIDWRNPEHYEYTNGYTNQLWAWEFLRRNAEYKKDWQAALTKYWEEKPSSERPQKQGGNYSDTYRDPPFITTATKKWPLPCLMNPSRRETPFTMFGDLMPPHFLLMGKQHPLYKTMVIPPSRILGDDELAVIIDVGMPIPLQIKAITDWLDSKATKPVKQKKTHKSKWIRYLRVFDANVAGVTRDVASNIIFTDIAEQSSKSMRLAHWDDTLKQAKRMVTKGYKNLWPYGLIV